MNIFQNDTKAIPKNSDAQIVRVSMTQSEIGGRKDHLPNQQKSSEMSINHLPNRG